MRRINPLGSLLGLILTVIFLIGLGLSAWVDRGMAFNPGQVTAVKKEGVVLQGYSSHAEFEKRCSLCHEPLRTNLATKCLECHAELNKQIQSNQGIHSKIQKVNTCELCHPEHRGREFNPTLAAYQLFDHSFTAFSLNWHKYNFNGTPLQCDSCHFNNDYGDFDNLTCINCHANHSNEFMVDHQRIFGSECLFCHDGVDRTSNFDHNTFYPLAGKHAVIQCSDCHQNRIFKGTPRECWRCHPEPELHKGMFGLECDFCHSDDAWRPATFGQHTFPLNHGRQNNESSKCDLCHVTSYSEYTCYGCHDHQPDETRLKHLEEGISIQELPFCAKCHPLGIKGEGGGDDD